MIGAIVLTLRHRSDIKRQDVLAQMYRDPAKAMELKDVKPGQGLDAVPTPATGRPGSMGQCFTAVPAIAKEDESGIGPEGHDMIGLEHYLTVAAALFVIGIFGLFLNRKNVIILLMSIELMLLSVNINLVAFSSFLGDLVGQVFTLFVLTVAGGRGGHRPCHPRLLLPQPRHHRRGRRQRDERLSR